MPTGPSAPRQRSGERIEPVIFSHRVDEDAGDYTNQDEPRHATAPRPSFSSAEVPAAPR